MSEEHKPHISAKTILPETTVKAFFLGAILSMVLAAANAYLGLFAGMTVSASIPAAVMSMAILRLFKNHNILENNIVQTAASAGESVAAGVIFTFPALILMGTWAEFKYWETFLIAVSGGILGVLFTVPLRSALIVKQKLLFPEGVATAEVLKTGEKGGKAVQFLVIGAILGAIVKLFASGMKLWKEVAEGASLVGGKAYAYFGMNLSPDPRRERPLVFMQCDRPTRLATRQVLAGQQLVLQMQQEIGALSELLLWFELETEQL